MLYIIIELKQQGESGDGENAWRLQNRPPTIIYVIMGVKQVSEKVIDYITTILADPDRLSLLLVLLEREGFRADDLSEEIQEI